MKDDSLFYLIIFHKLLKYIKGEKKTKNKTIVKQVLLIILFLKIIFKLVLKNYFTKQKNNNTSKYTKLL